MGGCVGGFKKPVIGFIVFFMVIEPTLNLSWEGGVSTTP